MVRGYLIHTKRTYFNTMLKLKKLHKRNAKVKIKILKKLFLDKEKNAKFPFFRRSVFYISRQTLMRLVRWQIIKHFLHIGLRKPQSHQGFRSLLLGFHNKISIIDLSLINYHFRRGLKFLLSNLLRNYRLCLISNQIEKYFHKKSFIFSYHMVFDFWIPGTISNYLQLSKQKVRREQHFLKRLPQVFVSFQLNPQKVYDINKEAFKAGLVMLPFLDSDIDPSFFNYFFPVNTKSLISFKYCLFLIAAAVRRSLFIKKSKFARKNVFKKNKTK